VRNGLWGSVGDDVDLHGFSVFLRSSRAILLWCVIHSTVFRLLRKHRDENDDDG
jgi:hypothetical protein